MKAKTILVVLVILLLASCVTTTRVASTFTPIPITNTETSPSATASVGSYPPCASPFTSSLPTSKPVLHLELSNNLTLKEYHGYPDIVEQESGCRYAYRDRAHIAEIILNNSFHIINEPIESLKEKVVVLSNDEKVFETRISQYVYSGLLEAWGYDNHWVIEFVTIDSDIMHDGIPPKNGIIDIVRDGVSLKEENNYQAVFGFQLLADKPFYFFKRQDNTFGVNYDGDEIELDYEDIPYTDPHPGLDKSVIAYENMVEFAAKKDGIWRTVVIGVFDK